MVVRFDLRVPSECVRALTDAETERSESACRVE